MVSPAEFAMFTDKSNIIAVVGVSANLEKYGYKIYKKLKEDGFKVYGVNPSYESAADEQIYPDLESLPERPTLVITVVPRAVTLEVIKKCKELMIPRVWMQPGSESPEAVEFCRKNGIKALYNMCFVADGLKAELD